MDFKTAESMENALFQTDNQKNQRTLRSTFAGENLTGNWDQSNNFCLRLSFFIIKQNGV